MIHRLSEQHTIANQFLAELRNIDIHHDRLRFRINMERLGQIFAYEISKLLTYEKEIVPTPLGEASAYLSDDRIVLATILRAGLPLHNGLLSYFDHADNAFVTAYRKHEKDGSFDIAMKYMTCPSLENSILIVSDPMLATGASIDKVLEELLTHGRPKSIHIVSVIAATQGLAYVHNKYPDVHIWIGDEDPTLNDQAYIVPGLGDAGDLAFGEKLQS